MAALPVAMQAATISTIRAVAWNVLSFSENVHLLIARLTN